jgi:hypothetical protein
MSQHEFIIEQADGSAHSYLLEAAVTWGHGGDTEVEVEDRVKWRVESGDDGSTCGPWQYTTLSVFLNEWAKLNELSYEQARYDVEEEVIEREADAADVDFDDWSLEARLDRALEDQNDNIDRDDW